MNKDSMCVCVYIYKNTTASPPGVTSQPNEPHQCSTIYGN